MTDDTVGAVDEECIEWTVRHVNEEDLDQLGPLDQAAFNSWFLGQGQHLEARSMEDLKALALRDPAGSFCAVDPGGQLLGYVFCRSWGRWGWMGPVGVAPDCQGQGIGSDLVRRAVEYLDARTAVFGLETMEENLRNITLYSQLGFLAVGPTLLLAADQRSADRGDDALLRQAASELLLWDQLPDSERSVALGELRMLFGALAAGLDYSKELLLARQAKTGYTAVWRPEGGPVKGFALVRTVSHRQDDTAGLAEIEAFGFEPSMEPEQAAAYISSLISELITAGKQRIRVWAPAGWGKTLEACSRLNLKPLRARQRMVHSTTLMNYLEAAEKALAEQHIHGATWAG
jgi:ribosomal protein S18 acetylase RimI-like enzyme